MCCAAGPFVSCLKVQIFLQMLLSYALPAALLYKWEAAVSLSSAQLSLPDAQLSSAQLA